MAHPLPVEPALRLRATSDSTPLRGGPTTKRTRSYRRWSLGKDDCSGTRRQRRAADRDDPPGPWTAAPRRQRTERFQGPSRSGGAITLRMATIAAGRAVAVAIAHRRGVGEPLETRRSVRLRGPGGLVWWRALCVPFNGTSGAMPDVDMGARSGTPAAGSCTTWTVVLSRMGVTATR